MHIKSVYKYISSFSFFTIFQRRSIKKPSIKIRNLWISDCRTHSTFSLFFLREGGMSEWEKKIFFNVIYRSIFKSEKKGKEWKEQHTKKIEINGWVENIHDWKHVWAEKCIIYCMIYLFWHKFPLKIFFVLLGDWYNGINGYEFEDVDVWIFIGANFLREIFFCVSLKSYWVKSIDD